MENDLIINLDKLHTTNMGVERIKRNLQVDVKDIVQYCHDLIVSKNANIKRKGKNWYVHIQDIILTVNAHSYTIITAHKVKEWVTLNEENMLNYYAGNYIR